MKTRKQLVRPLALAKETLGTLALQGVAPGAGSTGLDCTGISVCAYCMPVD
jgi:hypothetical protein